MNARIIAIQQYRYNRQRRKKYVDNLIIKDIDNIINSYASPLKEWDAYEKQLSHHITSLELQTNIEILGCNFLFLALLFWLFYECITYNDINIFYRIVRITLILSITPLLLKNIYTHIKVVHNSFPNMFINYNH